MAQDLTQRQTSAMTLPAELLGIFGDVESNVRAAAITPSLSFSGKVWRIKTKDVTMNVMRGRDDGEQEPETILQVIVIAVNEHRSRAYFGGKYDPESATPPVCWSYDGVKPDPSIAEPCAKTCAGCRWSVKGSATNDLGKDIVACGVSKRLVVVPANDPGYQPLLLKLPITSIYNPEMPHKDKGWYAWDQYVKFLQQNAPVGQDGKPKVHTAMHITAIRFDPDVEFPKLEFKRVKTVPTADPAYLAALAGAVKGEAAKFLAGIPGFDPFGAPAESYVAAPTAAPKAAEPEVEDAEDAEEVELLRQLQAKRAIKAAVAARVAEEEVEKLAAQARKEQEDREAAARLAAEEEARRVAEEEAKKAAAAKRKAEKAAKDAAAKKAEEEAALKAVEEAARASQTLDADEDEEEAELLRKLAAKRAAKAAAPVVEQVVEQVAAPVVEPLVVEGDMTGEDLDALLSAHW